MGLEIRFSLFNIVFCWLVWLIECIKFNYFNVYFLELNSLMRVYNIVIGCFMEFF